MAGRITYKLRLLRLGDLTELPTHFELQDVTLLIVIDCRTTRQRRLTKSFTKIMLACVEGEFDLHTQSLRVVLGVFERAGILLDEDTKQAIQAQLIRLINEGIGVGR